jgi:hypothetical protein
VFCQEQPSARSHASDSQKMPFVAGKGKGIAFVTLDLITGALVAGPTVSAGPNPSYLAMDSKKRFVCLFWCAVLA